MNAEKGFQLWRRILREPALEQAVFDGPPDGLVALGLDPDEIETAAALARHRAAATWPIRGYRYRVGDLTEETLQYYAPMTTLPLQAQGRMQPAVRRFLAAALWRENSGRLVELTCAFLEFLSASPEADLVPGYADLIRLELAANRLLLRLAPLPPEAWSMPAFVVREGQRYALGPTAEFVTLTHDLGPWIENPDRVGLDPVEPAPEHLMLVHLRDLDNLPDYARLTRAAGAVCAELARGPLDLAGVAAILGKDGEARARALMTRFAALGILRPEGAQARPAEDEQPFRYREWDEVIFRQAENAEHPVRNALAETLVDMCGDLDGARVLDLGAGDGRASAAMARRGAHVTGIDIAAGSLAEARTWVDSLGPELASRVVLREMDAGALDFPAGSFDTVTSLRSIWTFPDIPHVLGQVNRVLRPGGKFVVMLWELAVRDDIGAGDPPWLIGYSIVARYVPGISNADFVGSSSITVELLQSMVEGAELPVHLVAQERFTRRIALDTPAEYWALLSVVSANVHAFYARESADVRAAMDEEWRMESARSRRAAGAYAVDVTWGVAVFGKDG